MAEWPNAAVLKTVASKGAVSSNLTLSVLLCSNTFVFELRRNEFMEQRFEADPSAIGSSEGGRLRRRVDECQPGGEGISPSPFLFNEIKG